MNKYSKKDHIFVIDSWLNTPEKEQTLISLIDRIKEYGIQIMLVAHYPISVEIQKRVDYYLFDKENPILIHKEFADYFIDSKSWNSCGDMLIENIYPFHHDYAVWQSMRWSFNFCKTLGKKYIHFLEYDCLPNYTQYKQCFIERIEIENFDAIVLSFDNNTDYYTYIFSIKTEIAVEIINKIQSKSEYFTNKPSGFSIERVFKKILNETTSNILLSDYLDNDNSLNTHAILMGDGMNRGEYILKEFIGVDEDANLYLIMSSGFANKPAGRDYLVEFRYKNKTQFRKLNIASSLIVKLEKYQKNETLSILIDGIEIRRENFNLDFEEYRELNKAVLPSKKEKTSEIINKSDSLGDVISWIPIVENTSINHKDSLKFQNDIIFDFNNKSKVEIIGGIKKEYNLKFINKQNNKIVYESDISNNMWTQTNFAYFIDWNIQIRDKQTNSLVSDFNLDLKNKTVKIVNESPSMGDGISWVACVDLFQKKHNCIVDYYTPNKDLFEIEYPNINFYNYTHKKDENYYASYKIGCFDPNDNSISPADYRTQSLQQIATNILGLDHEEVKTKIHVKDKERKLREKYVCISTASTSGCKHWQHINGWQKVVDHLNDNGYKVVVIQKETLDYMDLQGLKNVIHPQTQSIHEAISWIYNCEFFIGLSSGNSWLAWALDKKVLLISGFTKSFNEFFTPYRVINESVCNGCWNDVKYKFNPGDWNWCPKYKNTKNQFECTTEISFEMVKEKLNNIINDVN